MNPTALHAALLEASKNYAFTKNKDWFSDISDMPEDITKVDLRPRNPLDFPSETSGHADVLRYATGALDDYQRGSRNQRTKPTLNPLLLLCN